MGPGLVKPIEWLIHWINIGNGKKLTERKKKGDTKKVSLKAYRGLEGLGVGTSLSTLWNLFVCLFHFYLTLGVDQKVV